MTEDTWVPCTDEECSDADGMKHKHLMDTRARWGCDQMDAELDEHMTQATEDIMEQMRRWTGQEKPPVLPIGEWWVWTIVRDNRMVNQVNRWPNVEF